MTDPATTARPTATPRGPVHRGRITRVRPDGLVDVSAPRLNKATEFQRCEVLEGPWTPLTLTTVDGHTHTQTTPPPLAAGDRVLIVFVEGQPDHGLVVIGRIQA